MLVIILLHLRAVLIAAACKHNAVLGADFNFLVTDLRSDAMNHLGLGILNEMRSRSLIPDINAVSTINNVLLQQVIACAIATKNHRRNHASRAIHRKRRKCARAFELRVFDIIERLHIRSTESLEPFLVLLHLINVNIKYGIGRRFIPATKLFEVRAHTLGILGVANPLHANVGVTARITLRGLLENKDLRARVSGSDCGRASGATQTNNNHVVLGIPFDRTFERSIGRCLVGNCKRRHGGSGRTQHGTGSDKLTTIEPCVYLWRRHDYSFPRLPRMGRNPRGNCPCVMLGISPYLHDGEKNSQPAEVTQTTYPQPGHSNSA